MDEDGARADETFQATKKNTRDGSIDFSTYSVEQLRELQYSIDPQAFPENSRRLLEALAGKQTPITQPQRPVDAVVGRFTSNDGLLGWLQAKWRRSPVYGIGSIEIGSSEIVLSAWQRTWLGAGVETLVAFPISALRNAMQDGTSIRFEIKRPYRPAVRILFQPESLQQTGRLLNKLPGVQTEGFLKRWSAIREFNEKLGALGGRPWVTPIIVAINVVVFAAMAVATKKLGQFTTPELLQWGANFGPLTVNGQWWRLLTALFIHLSLLHILLNMWALWNVGRLSERLFGGGTLLFLYAFAGVLASLTSIAWDPSLSSVGASGAIFGLFGALLAFLIRQRHQVPPTIVRKHWISTATFVLFNLVSGALQPGIDNTAHVGELPYLNEQNPAKVIEKYGPLIEEIRPRSDEQVFLFPNGIFVGAAMARFTDTVCLRHARGLQWV
jgi:membrane associated rhomboid family serine protease